MSVYQPTFMRRRRKSDRLASCTIREIYTSRWRLCLITQNPPLPPPQETSGGTGWNISQFFYTLDSSSRRVNTANSKPLYRQKKGCFFPPDRRPWPATGWMVRGSNLGGDEIYPTLPDRPWVPGLSGVVKRPGRGVDHLPSSSLHGLF